MTHRHIHLINKLCLLGTASAISVSVGVFGAAMAQTDQAAAFELLTDNTLPAGNVRFNDLAGQIAGIDTLDAFMEPFRRRFDGGGA